jgi:hypothetical protein
LPRITSDSRRFVCSAHLNLRDQYLPHKYLIGQVILDVSMPLSFYLARPNLISYRARYRKTRVYEQLSINSTRSIMSTETSRWKSWQENPTLSSKWCVAHPRYLSLETLPDLQWPLAVRTRLQVPIRFLESLLELSITNRTRSTRRRIRRSRRRL